MRSPPSSSSFCCRYFMQAITDSSFFTGPLAFAELGPCAAECPDANAAATSTGSTAISGRRMGASSTKDNDPAGGFPDCFAGRGSGLGQRNEFLLVAGNERKRTAGRAAPFTPVALRLFDARLRAGDEVPPDVARL